MKLATLGQGGQGSGVMSESAISFEDNATSFYAQISGLAEDKIGYPIRELVSNAWDASPGSVSVSLPCDEHPMFAVRDQGPGLSHEFIMGPFARMYFSDKRDDPNKVGGWGIGRFSAFGYLLSAKAGTFYMIASWHGGVRRDYIVDLNSEGRPVIKHMAETPSDEPSGLEVRFMVLKKDFESFRKRTQDILWSFDPRPTVVCDPEIKWPRLEEIASGTNWRRFLRWPEGFKQSPYLRMGPVAYPINMDHPDIKGHGTFVSAYLPILFDVPIGSVRPTLSREDLAYDGQTCETIRAAFARYANEIEEAVARAVAQSASYYEACLRVHEGVRFMGREPREAILRNVRWRDQPIREHIASTDTIRIAHCSRGWSRESVKTYYATGLFPHQANGARIIVEHRPQYSMDKVAALGLTGQHLVWIRCSKEDLQAALEYVGCGDDYTVIDDTPVERQRDDRPRHMRRRSLFLIGNGTSTRATEEIDLSQDQTYVRVIPSRSYPLKTWEGYDGGYYEPGYFNRLVANMQRLNWIRDRLMRCVAVSRESSVPDNWVPLARRLVQIARENGADMRVSALARLEIHTIPPEIRGLALLDRPLFQESGPPEMRELCRQAWDLGRAAEVHTRQHNPSYHSYHRDDQRPIELIKPDLAAIGFSSETDNPSEYTLGVIQALKTTFDRIAEEHPLFRMVSMSAGNNWYYGRRHERDAQGLFEYEAILRRIPEYAGDPEDE